MTDSREPIRMLHFSDLHIGMENFGQIDPGSGVNQRVLDFIQRLKEVVDYALEHEADLVLFTGDAFKTRDPSPTYQRELARQVMRLSQANLPTVLLVGNHDVPVIANRANSVDIFRILEVPNVIVGREESVHLVRTRRGVVQVATAPWPQRSRLLQMEEHRGATAAELDRALEEAVSQELQRLAEEVDPAHPAVLAAHFSVSGARYGSERTVMVGSDTVVKLSALSHPAWDYVALGHIHKHQDVNGGGYPAVVYAGSLERIDFGEEREPKGFCWVELRRGATTWGFVPVQARRFVTIDVDATRDGDEPTDAVLRAIERHDIADAVVRVRVAMTPGQEPLFRSREVEKALRPARFNVGVARNIQREARSRLGVENAESLTPAELLERYLLSKNTPPDRAEALLSLASDVFQGQP